MLDCGFTKWKLMVGHRVVMFLVALTMLADGSQAQPPDVFGRTFKAEDTVDFDVDSLVQSGGDKDTKAAITLKELGWPAEAFDVTCQKPLEWRYDCLVRFPSAGIENGTEYDAVAAEWHMARNEEGEIVSAPALVVVHESGKSMPVGRAFAMMLSRAGLHTFMVQLPGYGVRRDPDRPDELADTIMLMRQAVRDVRRARDAVSCLPLVNPEHIGVQGTSLGGFVAATAAGLDNRFDSVFIMLAGGNIYEVITNGQRDAASVRKRLEEQGLVGQPLKELLEKIEPINVAHRLDASKTWLFSANRDQVVPLENANAWARAVGLQPENHIILDADHYSGITYLPTMIFKIRDLVQQEVGQ